jgi:hypothetical protein
MLYLKFVKINTEIPMCQHRNPGFICPCPYRVFQEAAAPEPLPVNLK